MKILEWALGLLYGSFLVDAGEEVRYAKDPDRLARYRDSVFYLKGNRFILQLVDTGGSPP